VRMAQEMAAKLMAQAAAQPQQAAPQTAAAPSVEINPMLKAAQDIARKLAEKVMSALLYNSSLQTFDHILLMACPVTSGDADQWLTNCAALVIRSAVGQTLFRAVCGHCLTVNLLQSGHVNLKTQPSLFMIAWHSQHNESRQTVLRDCKLICRAWFTFAGDTEVGSERACVHVQAGIPMTSMQQMPAYPQAPSMWAAPGSQLPAGPHFESELEINDFPQHARWKVRKSLLLSLYSTPS
jgi:hypothetical protein